MNCSFTAGADRLSFPLLLVLTRYLSQGSSSEQNPKGENEVSSHHDVDAHAYYHTGDVKTTTEEERADAAALKMHTTADTLTKDRSESRVRSAPHLMRLAGFVFLVCSMYYFLLQGRLDWDGLWTILYMHGKITAGVAKTRGALRTWVEARGGVSRSLWHFWCLSVDKHVGAGSNPFSSWFRRIIHWMTTRRWIFLRMGLSSTS